VQSPPTIWTVGHGARTTEEFVTVLGSAGIRLLIDVRRHPGSRRHPQFSRDRLAADLAAHGVRYDWRGDALGGRREPAQPTRHPEWSDPAFQGFADYADTDAFRSALVQLVDTASHEPAAAVMCAEMLWTRCHRRLIADALMAAGVDVIHLVTADHHEPHPRGLV
jgi:uncharacterized protein (DUF488 family)